MNTNAKVFEYPVFAISSSEDYIVSSGGGGGQSYGIFNKLEIYNIGPKFKANELKLKVSTCKQNGIIDSLDYHNKYKIWIGSIGDSTILFSYKPNFGYFCLSTVFRIRIFGKFKTDNIKNDPKQNVCKFGQDGNYFVTGGNECCVRVWRLNDKLIRRVNRFQEHFTESVNSVKFKRFSSSGYKDKKEDLNSDEAQSEETMPSDPVIVSDMEDGVYNRSEVRNRKFVEKSSSDLSSEMSNIDDTSPSPSTSPALSPVSSNAKLMQENELSSIDILELNTKTHTNTKIHTNSQTNSNTDTNSNTKTNSNTGNNTNVSDESSDVDDVVEDVNTVSVNEDNKLCKLMLEHREHTKSINDCCILHELVVSVCDDYLVFYKIIPSKLLLKHKLKNNKFKFCAVLGSNSNGIYQVLTVQFNTQEQHTLLSLWNFNINNKRLSLAKSREISKDKSSSMTLSTKFNRLAVGFGSGSVLVYNLSFKLLQRFNHHQLPVTDLTFLSAKKLLTSGIDYYVHLNDLRNKRQLYLLALTLLVLLIAINFLY